MRRIPEGGGRRERYKFQALVTLYAGKGRERREAGSGPRRMVLRGRNDETGRSQFFAALVSCDDEGPFRPGSPQWLVTLRLAGDDAPITSVLAATSTCG